MAFSNYATLDLVQFKKMARYILFVVHQGKSLTTNPVDSESYTSPENLRCHFQIQTKRPVRGYDPLKADIWSCGVVLFVLMYGNTPWELARETSPEYRLYKHTEVS